MRYFNNPQAFFKLVLAMQDGFANTLSIFFLTLIFSIPLGMVIALLRMSKRRIISIPVSLYILIMRGTPLMLQVITVHFILPGVVQKLIPGFKIDRYISVLFAFALNYAAYFAEIYRGGIQSIPQGQYEAGKVLGFTRAQTFFHIILPQVVKRVLLPVCNEVITLIKDTALASTVAVVDLMTVAKKQVSSSSSIEPYLVAIIMYLILNGVAEQLCKLAEKKMDYYR